MTDNTSAARGRRNAETRRVVVLQSLWRRKLAVRELKQLKVEAKSVSKLKEASYQLENKLIEVTKTLQKQKSDNKALDSKVGDLEKAVAEWKAKHDDLASLVAQQKRQLEAPSVSTSVHQELLNAKAESDGLLERTLGEVQDHKAENEQLSTQLESSKTESQKHQHSLDQAQVEIDEAKSTIADLKQRLASLERANTLNTLTKGQRDGQRDAPSSPTLGLREFTNGIPLAEGRGQATTRRRQRRHSTTGHGGSTFLDEDGFDIKPSSNPRAVSVMFPQANNRSRDSNGLPTVNDTSTDEVLRLLQDEESLDDDVLQGLIANLKIPAASLHNPPLAKEVIFPAHLISLVSNEMWKLGMIPESERFLANVMQSIQTFVMVCRSLPVKTLLTIFRLSRARTLSFPASFGSPTSKRFCLSSASPSPMLSRV
jgi:myosin-5